MDESNLRRLFEKAGPAKRRGLRVALRRSPDHGAVVWVCALGGKDAARGDEQPGKRAPVGRAVKTGDGRFFTRRMAKVNPQSRADSGRGTVTVVLDARTGKILSAPARPNQPR